MTKEVWCMQKNNSKIAEINLFMLFSPMWIKIVNQKIESEEKNINNPIQPYTN